MIEMRRANEGSLHYPDEKLQQENIPWLRGEFRGEVCMPRMFGAQERTRTSTTVRPLAPEASASASSATWAPRPTHSLYRLTVISVLSIFFFLPLNYE